MKRHHQPRHMDGLAVAELFYSGIKETTTMTTIHEADLARREVAAKMKARKIARRDELGRRRSELLAAEKGLLSIAPNHNELLEKYIGEVDYMADQYRREFGFKNQRASTLELTSHKAMCYFLGDTIKARLVDLIQPGGMPEAERLSRLHTVQTELASVSREYDGIVIA